MREISKHLNIIKSFVCYLSIYIFSLIICSIINLVYILLKGLFFGDFDFGVDIFYYNIEYYNLIVRCVTIFIYYKWYKKLKKKFNISYKLKIIFFDKICLLLCSIGTILITYGVMNLLLNLLMEYYSIFIIEYNKLEYINSNITIISVINTIFTAPLSEELVFRGVILRKAEQIMPFFIANILQSFLFALVHMNLVMFIYTFPIGLLYGYITIRYNSILPVVYLHILNNTIAIITIIITRNQETFINTRTSLWVLITIIGICLNVIFMYNIRKKN